MDSPMTLALHEEFAKRMQDEHDRQNHRISKLEKEFDQNNKLLVSVEKLALSIENMQRELKNQSDRLDEIEGRDGKKWRDAVGYVVSTVIGAVICFIFTQIGM